MDQTKNNMDRIRAFDAEEGEWRTINGAHVLIKNGRIAGGAGGALNGQPFRGGSLKKMPAGSKGSKFNENREKASVRWATSSVFGPTPAGLNKKRLDPIPNNVTTEVPHYDPSRRYTIVKGRPDGIGKISDPIKYDVLEGARPIETGSFGTTFEAAHKQLTVPHYAHWASEGSAYMEPSKTELAARARSLKKRRPDLFKAGRTASPASRLSKMPEGHKGMESGAYGRKLESQAKEVAERNRAAMAMNNARYSRNHKTRMKHMRYLRSAFKALEEKDLRESEASTAKNKALNREIFDLAGKAARHESNRGEVESRAQRAIERYRKSREAERGGSTSQQQSAHHATKLGRMQSGSKAVNAGKEAKRLDHNARVYHRTARRAREAYNAKMDKAGGEPNVIEQKKSAYKAKSDANVSRRDQAAASAKERLSKLRQLAKSLKARNPNAFKG